MTEEVLDERRPIEDPGGDNAFWLVAEKLTDLGAKVLNSDITGMTHLDRKLITGDSPLASNNVGKAASNALLKDSASWH